MLGSQSNFDDIDSSGTWGEKNPSLCRVSFAVCDPCMLVAGQFHGIVRPSSSLRDFFQGLGVAGSDS
jgi:hypothetical protein